MVFYPKNAGTMIDAILKLLSLYFFFEHYFEFPRDRTNSSSLAETTTNIRPWFPSQ